MVPSMGQKYFRLVRWADHMGFLGRSMASKGPLAELPKVNVQSIEDAMAGLDLKSGKPAAPAPKPKEKAEKKAAAPKPAPAVVEVASHPFARVDLRVGKIIKAERHPAADRLFIETVDLGEAEPRTVVSGLVGHVELESLQDRLAVFICNLKPATLCKTVSSAMLLVSKDADGLEPLAVPAGAKAGDRVSVEGVTPQPDAVIKPKEDTWEKVRVDLKVVNGVAHWQDKPLLVAGGHITSTKAPNGEIS
jgi:methionine--tRNA ligase beta chain